MHLDDIPPSFWEIIALLNWGQDLDEGRCRKLLASPSLIDAMKKKNITTKCIKNHLSDIVHIINDETHKRVDNDSDVFADHVMYSADDCHFMDMPSHLVALGKESVEKYLQGGLIEFEPIECFSYVFNDD